ncbi:MAG TPA: hypothetical protein VFW68_03315 [Rhodocyclaceae bacterium]|nr:hypothetical protein [Rhodocyclaceae bacterium]
MRIVGDDAGFSAQVAARVDAALRRMLPDVRLDGDQPASSQHRLLIAIGTKGARAIDGVGAETLVLAVLPPKHVADGGGERAITAIYGDMPPGRLINFAQLVQGRRSGSIGLVAGPVTQSRLPRLEAAASERGARLHVEKIERENDAGPAVERVVRDSGVLLALPDPIAHTAGTVPPLLVITYWAGVPVIGYSEAYLRAGAVAVLYCSPEQIALQVAEVVAIIRQGKGLPPPQYLKYFIVGVNASVARSLGMSLPSAEELEVRLKGMRE